MSITVDRDLASVTFTRYELEDYETFLRAKALPETQLTYDWRTDSYRLTTPARFAARLGATARN